MVRKVGCKSVGALAALAVVVAGCADVPLHDKKSTFAIEVSTVSENQDPIQLDFLWIIDNSASMCQEQFALSQSFSAFAKELQTYLKNIDIRVAVTTTDAMNMAGKFNEKAATTFPPACFETRQHPCLGNADCVKEFGNNWDCKAYSADKMYNDNCSINSTCTFRCKTDGDCCGEFCFFDTCGADQSCLVKECADAPNADCPFSCRTPSQGTSSSGCLRPPATGDCPTKSPKVLTMATLDKFKCIATVEPEQSYQSNLEQGLEGAWKALDPNGPNADQAAGFLRPNAYLIIVFVTDEDDCSIDPSFASPNYVCETDKDCPKGSTCEVDSYYSTKIMGKKVKLCHGIIKKDFYNICSLLGDYKGVTHHNCAYDKSCSDCQSDEDCEYGWRCAGKTKKCEPEIFSLGSLASFQTPPGAPRFALTPVAEYYSRFRSLKSDPAKVLVAAITGDGLPKAPAKKSNTPECPSLVSETCLKNELLLACQDYVEAREAAEKYEASAGCKADPKPDGCNCIKDPDGPGCHAFFDAKLACIRECYVSAKGAQKNSTEARNSYICLGEGGKADFGSRYVVLADMFGPNGMVSNICAEDGIVPALKTIAELVIKRVTKVCLPIEVKGGESIVVTMTLVNADGTLEPEVRFVEGPAELGGDYRIESPTQECCFPDDSGQCTGTLKAITFNKVLDPRARIEIRYEAQLEEQQ